MAGLPDPGMKIDRDRTALVVTDPQNDAGTFQRLAPDHRGIPATLLQSGRSLWKRLQREKGLKGR